MTLPTSRVEAKRISSKRYATGKPCKNDHLSDRWTSSGRCIQCIDIFNHENSQLVNEYKNKWRMNNREKDRQISKIQYQKNKSTKSIYSANYFQSNKDRLREVARIRRSKNPHINAASTSRYKASKLRAIPSWADKTHISKIYQLAAIVSALTGIPHEVDHDIPLRNKNVCGLHVEANLKIIPASFNKRKSNKYEVNSLC